MEHIETNKVKLNIMLEFIAGNLETWKVFKECGQDRVSVCLVRAYGSATTVLPYFAQLAKVFSQGKYYVGGPRKVQICRNSLLTNTLIMRFCLFIVVNNCFFLSRTIHGTCAPICLFTVTVSTRECLASSSLSKSNTPLCTEIILLVEIQI
jgi:hypothetical protein